MLGRRNKPKTIEELPSRYLDLGGPRLNAATSQSKRVQTPALLLIGALVACLVVAAVFVYRATVPQLNAPPKPAFNAQAVATILDAARVYLNQEDYSKAEIVLSTGVRENPEDQELRVAYAETLLMNEQIDSAYHQYTEALRIGPRDADLEFAAGTLANKMNEFALAEAHFSAAHSKDPITPAYGLFLAQVQLKQDKYDEAIASLVKVRPLDPDNAMIYGTLAEIYFRTNKTDVCLDQIGYARQIEPERTAWKVIEARALERKGQAERALLILNSIPLAERNAKPILRNRAECFGMLSRQADAAQMYRDASDAAPGDPELAFEAALWSDKAGQSAPALDYGHRAQKLGHEHADKFVKRLVDAGG